MRALRRTTALVASLVLASCLAGAGCGKYGPPQRVRPVQGAAPAPALPAPAPSPADPAPEPGDEPEPATPPRKAPTP